MFWLDENFQFVSGLAAIGILVVTALAVPLIVFVSAIKESLSKWDSPFDQETLMATQRDWQNQISKMQKELNEQFIETQRQGQEKLLKMQGNINTRKMMVLEGTETKQIKKADMYDSGILFCVEVGGRCKGAPCAHYREDINGSDICRLNALEFVD